MQPSRRAPRLFALQLVGAFLILTAGATQATGPSRPGGPVAPALVENAGQFDPAVHYRVEIAGMPAWLTRDAVWLMVSGPGSSGTAIRLDFGVPLDWEPFAQQATAVRYLRAGQPLRPRAWGGVHARIGPGVELSITAAGIEIGGAESWPVTVLVQGGATTAGAGGVRVDGRLLPLRWTIPIAVNAGQPVPTGGAQPAAGAAPANNPALLFSTFIGGELWDEAEAIGLDAEGNVYVAGQTLSLTFPASPGPFTAPLHAVESFVARFNWNGTALDYINVWLGDVEDWGSALAVDAAGNAYLGGYTDSTDFPATPGAYDSTPNGGFDGFVMKFAPDGEMIFATLIGGGEFDRVSAIAVDDTGAVTIAGTTFSDGATSAPFPTTGDAYERIHSGNWDAFVARFSPDGTELTYSTFLGGSGTDQAEALALDSGGVVVAGCTGSPDFAVPAGGYDTVLNGPVDGFVVRLSPGSPTLDFWTYLGGSDPVSCDQERAQGVVIDADGNVFVVGRTQASDFPATPGSIGPSFGGGDCFGSPCTDGFAAMLSADGTSLLWAAFLGGSGDDSVESVALDAAGNLVAAGVTASANFPVTGDAFDASLDGLTDAFVLRISAQGDHLYYGSFLGGAIDEKANAVAVGPQGWIYLAGWTDSLDFPTTPLAFDPDPNFNAQQEVFVTVLIPPGSPGLEQAFLPLVTK